MACPHSLIGDPATCSQCHGFAPRIVWRDETTGTLMIDDAPAARTFTPGVNARAAAYYQRGARASGRAKRKL